MQILQIFVLINFFYSIQKNNGKELKEGENFYKILNNEESIEVENELAIDSLKHNMLGYSYFILNEPREDEKYADYYTLLLQIYFEVDKV